jgi:hypothetical protein
MRRRELITLLVAWPHGLIAYNGQIEIHTSLLNVVLHEEPHINS